MAASSSMTTTSSATSRMIFSGYSTSFSTTTTSRLLPFITTMSKCRAFHFHHRLLHLHAGLYKNSRIHFTHSTYSPSFFVAGKYGVIIKGKRAVVIGGSNIVGMPAALLLQRKDATVSVVHSRTKNPEKFIREADIIIAAVGRANMVKGSWIKPGAVIIDVGINPVEDAKSPRGYQLVGDMCCDEASKITSAITPVPGGVGPMTVAMLLSNTLTSAKRIHSLK